MKRFSLLFLFFSAFIHPQTFHSLDGLENQQGQTILLYRLGSDFFIYNPVYEFNTSTLQEDLIMDAYNYEPGQPLARGIWDFEFFPEDENNFMNVGHYIMPDDYGFIARNDSNVFIEAPGEQLFVDISKQDPLKVFVFPSMIRSWDGGYTFPIDSIPATTNFTPLSMADFDDEIFFGYNEDGEFCKNGAVVDTSGIAIDRYFKMMYDPDQLHIYRFNKNNWNNLYSFSTSNDSGNTWANLSPYFSPSVLSIDNSMSGNLYLASGMNIIWKTTNYGSDFIDYKSIPYKILGLYKKPSVDTIFAATRFKIFKVTADTVISIKTLPVPNEEFDWFPLKIGNKWVYKKTYLDYYCIPDYIRDVANTITKDTLIGGKTYFEFHPPLGVGYFKYVRIDSTEGKLMAISGYINDSSEVPIYDFYMEPGDSVKFGFAYPDGGVALQYEDSILAFNKVIPQRNFSTFGFIPDFSFSLAKGIGLYNEYICEFGGVITHLKGCVLDGIVYGDTTTTAVDDNRSGIPENIVLYQNYPNPFNPSTTIKYSLSSRQFVNLTVYDITGREIALLLKEEKPAGTYEIKFNGTSLPSGVYFCKMQAGEHYQIMKMILLK